MRNRQFPLHSIGPTRLIVTFIHGNAIGVIEEPLICGGVPPEQRKDLWHVKIGIIDETFTRSFPFPEQQFQQVTGDLLSFLKDQGVECSDCLPVSTVDKRTAAWPRCHEKAADVRRTDSLP